MKDPDGNKFSYKNYRPISVTSIVARVVERVIKKIMMSWIERKDILKPYQYGGRSSRGTTDALAHAYEEVDKNVNKYHECHGVFLDIAKAFDRLNRKLITWTLIEGDLDVPIIMWINNFLNKRVQRIKIGGNVSDWKSTISGGPKEVC